MRYAIHPSPEIRPGELLDLFRASVHQLTAIAYDDTQRAAWAPEDLTPGQFAERLSGHRVWHAESGHALAGFASLSGDGRFGLLYVHPHFARQGIGGALVETVEAAARTDGHTRLAAEVSLIAAPVFRRRGWHGGERHSVTRRGVTLEHFHMEKFLSLA